jgi:tetratricopeptide (TPR) repeat protein
LNPIFISYARWTSGPYAEALHQALARRGVGAFLDRADLGSGTEFPGALTTALLEARVFVLFADDVYFTRWYCLRELRLALAAFETLAARGASALERRNALEHVVVALSPSGVDEADMRRLPPEFAQTSWPSADATAEVADLVLTRLRNTPLSVGARHREARVPSERFEPILWQSLQPPPGNLAGLALHPLELPPSLHDDFVGRADDLWQLDWHLSTLRGTPATAALTGVLAGGAGYGKTRLALEYLHRFGPLHFRGGLFWLDASRPTELLDEQFHGIWQRLDPERHTRSLKEFRAARRSVRDALAEALHDRAAENPVLYVVDNVEETPAAGAPEPLATWCPALGKVTVLVTSRSHATANALGIRALAVDVLEMRAAVELLVRGVHHRGIAAATWADIAAAVGNLPLALELLNAALRRGLVTPAELLRRLERSGTTRLLDRTMELLRGQVPRRALRGISEALAVSYDCLSDEVRRTARVLAFLGPEAIPLDLADTVFPAGQREEFRARLLMHSILTPVTGTNEPSVPLLGKMHRVVGDFLRVQSGEGRDERHAALGAVLTVVTSSTAEDSAESDLLMATMPHAIAMLGYLERERDRDPRNGERLLSLAKSLFDFGDRAAENAALQTAVAAYREALKEYTRERTPLEWARTQNNLGAALQTLGNRDAGTKYVEEAAGAYREVLKERTREREPIAWATTLQNLATTVSTLGEREANTQRLEEAIALYRMALEELTRERAPLQWAMTQSNLGATLQRLGERKAGVEHAEEAITAYREALKERTRERVPLQWAMTQSNLGLALQTLGERQANVERFEEAVSAYREALKEFTRERVPLHWAMVQDNLGTALALIGERLSSTRYLEDAVITHREALLMVPRETAPLEWARVQVNLATTLRKLGERETRNESLEEAVARYREALEERTRDRVPVQWASTQNDLGIALHALGAGEMGVKRLEEAAIAFRSALEVIASDVTRSHGVQENLTRAEHLLAKRRGAV